MSQRVEELASMIAGQTEYKRERIDPRLDDLHYIHLSDLLLCLQTQATDKAIRILDFGAGVSPYESLFPNATYQKADICDLAGIEYVLRDDGTVPAPSAVFDLVMSTQVLEHVPSPRTYLSECMRVLRIGGTLILSTHGLFEDHGCPYDFQRWTADGLCRELCEAGFDVEHLYKLSSGTRALIYLFERWANTSSKSPGKVVDRLLGRRVRRMLHSGCDRRFPECRVVNDTPGDHKMYIAILAVARKSQLPTLSQTEA